MTIEEFKNKYGVTADGLVVPYFEDYKVLYTLAAQKYIDPDFEIDSSEEIGEMFEVWSYVGEEISRLLLLIYGSMFPQTASGTVLDNYALEAGIERSQGSYASGELEIDGTAFYIVKKGFQVAKSGNYIYSTIEDVQLDLTGYGVVKIQSIGFGTDYNASIGDVNIVISNNEYVNAVMNVTPIEGGKGIESDAELRERIFGGNGTGDPSLPGIKNALKNNSKLRKVEVYQNATEEYDSVYELEPTQIKIIASGVIDQEIAEIIFQTISAGIETVGNVAFNVTSEDGQISQIKIQEADEILLYIRISNIVFKQKLTDDELKLLIYESVNQELDNDDFGYKLNYEKIRSRIQIISFIDEVDVEISTDGNVYVQNDIILDVDEFASLDINNIIIEETT
ncbi:Uncharacterized homolog of phage Mu protein gp47 [Sebaldella termitidis]|uniref:Baseplate protein J-like barrel domain-containing protein n=1 Tax=Sebaldella termitidis (strain ATCC 33386 / NCTC 11300) TaxID=526218 RepID=D1AN60_SEBTE|nr:baseplate J/gp47 family protein [Sebaldella termitidis]ACZ09664.1 hypothetical protein Sterm_2820 [Sebaldella termitidis ATCC 33386]SUI24996.1 Uncharacterized homolog of phage Mu protein gp47 [Sebaldella termitidis]